MNSKVKNWLLFIATVAIVILLSLLANSIISRKTESQFAYQPQVQIEENEPRNAVWGENFPRQYQSFMRTQDTSFTSYLNGSKLRDALEKKFGEPMVARLKWQAVNELSVEKNSRAKILNIIDLLEENDDVQNVYSNLKVNNDE